MCEGVVGVATHHAAIDKDWQEAHLTDVHERVLHWPAQQVDLLVPAQSSPCSGISGYSKFTNTSH